MFPEDGIKPAQNMALTRITLWHLTKENSWLRFITILSSLMTYPPLKQRLATDSVKQ
jgi:hypothetical protein